MARPTHVLPTIVLALALAACQGAPTKPGASKPTGPVATAAAPKLGSLASARAGLVGLDGATLIGMDGSTLVGLDGSTLIGMDGSTLVGQDGATLIGLDGATLVGNDGSTLTGSVSGPAGLVAAGGGNYSLLQASEKPLAGVRVYLRTATGRFVFDPTTKKLLSATTDAQGQFSFPNLKALRGIMAYVPQARAGSAIRGLLCVRPADAAANAPLTIDLAASLQAEWIYTRLLAAQAEKDRPASLDRLTSQLAAEARAAIAKAAPSAADLGPAALADAADQLGQRDPQVAQALAAIREVVGRIGANSTEAGRGATQTALLQPQDVAVGQDGALFVLEAFGGIVRRFDADGRDAIVVGIGSPSEAALGALVPTDLTIGPDGQLYLTSSYSRQVFRFTPDGTSPETVFGGGTTPVETGALAVGAAIRGVGGLCFDPQGRLIVGEGKRNEIADAGDARILRLEADRTLTKLTTPWDGLPPLPGLDREILALGAGADGTLYVLEYREGTLHRLEPGATAWTLVARGLLVTERSDLLPVPGGDVLITEGAEGDDVVLRHGITRVRPDGTVSQVAGGPEAGSETEDRPALAARFAAAAGLCLRPDGTVLVADADAGLVRALGLDGQVRLVAGKPAGLVELAKTATLSVPSGLAIDPQGRVVVSEFGSHAVRRQEGDRLVTIVGGLPGRGKDGGPADHLLRPVGLAYIGDDLLVVDTGSQRVLRVRGTGAAATMTVIAGGGAEEWDVGDLAQPRRATNAKLRDLFGVAVAPDGTIAIADANRIWAIKPDGMMTLLTGVKLFEASELIGEATTSREGQPAAGLRTGRMSGLVYDKAGNLYASEFSTCSVIKIDTAGRFSTFAGAGLGASLSAVLDRTAESEPDGPRLQAALLMPMGLAFDAQERLYITEIGTRATQALAGRTPEAMSAIPLLDGRIRRVDPDGTIRTLAGLGSTATGEEVRNPVGIVITPAGKVVFVDNGTNQIKEL